MSNSETARLLERITDAVASVTDRMNDPEVKELISAENTPRVRPSMAIVSWPAIARSLAPTWSRAPLSSPEAIRNSRSTGPIPVTYKPWGASGTSTACEAEADASDGSTVELTATSDEP